MSDLALFLIAFSVIDISIQLGKIAKLLKENKNE